MGVAERGTGRESLPASETTVVLPRARRRAWADALTPIARDVLLPYAVTRALLVLVGLLASYYLLPLMGKNLTHYALADNTRFPHALWLMWRRFDAGFYLDLARHGYWPASTLRHLSNWVFYPLFPLLVRPVALALGGSDTAYSIAALLVSNAAAIVALAYLHRLVTRELGRPVAARAVLFLALFPTSFYLSSMYPHALLLACAVACIYYARTRRWWLAGLCGGLAALTRAQGLLVIVPLAWELWQALADRFAPILASGGVSRVERLRLLLASRLRALPLAARDGGAWLSLLALTLVPLGALAFMLYARVQTGDFFASSHNEAVWGRRVTAPWTILLYSLRHPAAANPLDWNFWPLNIVVAVAFLGAVVWAFARLPMIYALYALVMTLAPLASNSLQSLARYDLAVFPAFMLLALWAGRGDAMQRTALVAALFAALQAVFMTFFVLALPAIA